MIDQLKSIAVFAKTVECGSFRGAAKELQLSPSVVSHHISQLEDQLGVALLYRSTRRLALTSDGEKLIGHAREVLRIAGEGIDAVTRKAGELAGELRITAPALLTNSKLADRIASFARRYPKVRLELNYTEVPLDMIAEGIDVAIRVGWLTDSSLKARKLYSEPRVLLASSSYLRERRSPGHPGEIKDWDWLELGGVQSRHAFTDGQGQTVSLKPRAQLSANNAEALYQLSRRGAGLVVLPRFLAQEDLQTGKMVNVLPEWKLKTLGVYAVRPANSPKEGNAASFVKWLAEAGDAGLA